MAEKNSSFCDVAFYALLWPNYFRLKYPRLSKSLTLRPIIRPKNKKKNIFVRNDIQAKVCLNTNFFKSCYTGLCLH